MPKELKDINDRCRILINTDYVKKGDFNRT
jgi:hypothetical protein